MKALVYVLIIIFLSSIGYAEVQNLGAFKINNCIALKQLGAGFSNCTLTSVQMPNNTIMTYTTLMNKNGLEYDYNYCDTGVIGSYIVNGYCSEPNGDTVWNYNFDITNNGNPILNPITTIAIAIGLILIIALFIVFTIITARGEHTALAHFFFLGVFIFTTVETNFIWRIAYDNGASYTGLLLTVYRIMLIITALVMLYILVILSTEAIKVRRFKNNSVDTYRDNLR